MTAASVEPILPWMRIAEVAPLHESVPPRQYGGTERVVSYLTEELVARGHDVTLFGSGDSETRARLVPVSRRGLRLGEKSVDAVALHLGMLLQVYERAGEFDVIHCHTDLPGSPPHAGCRDSHPRHPARAASISPRRIRSIGRSRRWDSSR